MVYTSSAMPYCAELSAKSLHLSVGHNALDGITKHRLWFKVMTAQLSSLICYLPYLIASLR